MTMMASFLDSFVSKMPSLSTSDHASVVSLNLFVALLCACIVLGHLLEENRWMNESITALMIVSIHWMNCLFSWIEGNLTSGSWLNHLEWLQGLATGVVILLISNGKSSRLLVFSEDLFFIYLLPPIIFNAGSVFFLFFFASIWIIKCYRGWFYKMVSWTIWYV